MRKYFIEPSIMSQGTDKKDSRREGMKKGVDKKDCRREAMEKPTRAKTTTWVPQETTKGMSKRMPGAAKAMAWMTPTQSSWRIWNPCRNDMHIVLKGVIV